MANKLVAKSHVLTGTSSLMALGAVDLILLNAVPTSVSMWVSAFNAWLGGGLPFYVGVLCSLFMYYLGVLLPDIDYPNSWICKRVKWHFDVEHRTITHALWFPMLYLALGFAFRPFVFLALGYVVHLFFDSMTPTGVVWFYKSPNDFIRYESGVKIKRGHFWHFYKTGEKSETVVVVVSWMICVIIWIAFFMFVCLK